jgi:hypothetical protein
MNIFENWSIQSWLDSDNLFVAMKEKIVTAKGRTKGMMIAAAVAACAGQSFFVSDAVSSVRSVDVTLEAVSPQATDHIISSKAFSNINNHIAQYASGEMRFPSEKIAAMARRAAAAVDANRDQSIEEWADNVIKNSRLA